MTKINDLNRISHNTEPLHEKASRRSPEFARRMSEAVKDVNRYQHIADDSVEKVILGEMGIHEGMLALGKAETSLKVLAQVRNKALTAYNETMRMQI